LTEINIGQRPAGTLGSGPVIKETTMRERAPGWMMDGNE
jgi:hypothetical protein